MQEQPKKEKLESPSWRGAAPLASADARRTTESTREGSRWPRGPRRGELWGGVRLLDGERGEAFGGLPADLCRLKGCALVSKPTVNNEGEQTKGNLWSVQPARERWSPIPNLRASSCSFGMRWLSKGGLQMAFQTFQMGGHTSPWNLMKTTSPAFPVSPLGEKMLVRTKKGPASSAWTSRGF